MPWISFYTHAWVCVCIYECEDEDTTIYMYRCTDMICSHCVCMFAYMYLHACIQVCGCSHTFVHNRTRFTRTWWNTMQTQGNKAIETQKIYVHPQTYVYTSLRKFKSKSKQALFVLPAAKQKIMHIRLWCQTVWLGKKANAHKVQGGRAREARAQKRKSFQIYGQMLSDLKMHTYLHTHLNSKHNVFFLFWFFPFPDLPRFLYSKSLLRKTKSVSSLACPLCPYPEFQCIECVLQCVAVCDVVYCSFSCAHSPPSSLARPFPRSLLDNASKAISLNHFLCFFLSLRISFFLSLSLYTPRVFSPSKVVPPLSHFPFLAPSSALGFPETVNDTRTPFSFFVSTLSVFLV